jgi:hypothetical protein
MAQAELRDLFEALGAEPSTAFRLVPIDPCKELTTGNARLVRREVRIRALRAWSDARKRHSGKEGSNARDAYMAALQNAAAAASKAEGGQGQPAGLVAEEEQRGEVGDDEQEEQVGEEEEEGTDDEGDDDADDDNTIRL